MKPCPFCGAKEIGFYGEPVRPDESGHLYSAECTKCHARGPLVLDQSVLLRKFLLQRCKEPNRDASTFADSYRTDTNLMAEMLWNSRIEPRSKS